MHAHAHACPSKEAACRPMRRLLSDQLPPPVVLVPCPFHLFPSARGPTHLTSSQCGRIVPLATLASALCNVGGQLYRHCSSNSPCNSDQPEMGARRG